MTIGGEFAGPGPQCPTCGPTQVEQHPRRRVLRCINCKEHLAEVAAAPAVGRRRPGRWTSRLGEWLVLGSGLVILCLLGYPFAALGFLAGYLLLSLPLQVRRSRFLDVGRWTVGLWSVQEPVIVHVAFMRYRPGARPCGLAVTLGRATAGIFTLMPRQEWAEFKARRGEQG